LFKKIIRKALLLVIQEDSSQPAKENFVLTLNKD